jgi:quinol monooxygenase YgiN
MGNVVILSKVVVAAGCRTLAISALSAVIGEVGSEPGTLEWTVYEAEEPDVFWVHEVYVDEEAFQAHLAGRALHLAREALTGLTAGPPELNRLIPVLGIR